MESNVVPADYLAYLASRPLTTDDPRPELRIDSELWSQLLNLAAGYDLHDLRGTLHGLRCLGARIARVDGKLRILPGEMGPTEYAAHREKYLLPHADELQMLMAKLHEPKRRRGI